MSDSPSTPLLELRGVSKYFPSDGPLWSRSRRLLRALEGVSLHVERGETLALVGESGSGKSTLGRIALRLHDPSAGSVHFDGQDISHASQRALRPLRKRMQIIFQDPYSSLNPRLSVHQTLAEPLRVHQLAARGAAEARAVTDLLARVGLPASARERYPHEFSGGQRQRIGIARALAVRPDFIVCDEPVSALDVSIQAQIINLLLELQDELKLSYLFISHDLRVVRHMSHRVAVLYLGQLIELAPTDALYEHPKHPYTRALLDAAPSLEVGAERTRLPLLGELPSPFDPPSGCVFHPRCPRAVPGECDQLTPPLRQGADGHAVACFHPHD